MNTRKTQKRGAAAAKKGAPKPEKSPSQAKIESSKPVQPSQTEELTSKHRNSQLNTGNSNQNPNNPQALSLETPSAALSVLQNLDKTDPEKFQTALADLLEDKLLEGLADMPPPRSIKDAMTLNSMVRKIRRLDEVKGSTGMSVFVSPLRSVTRTRGISAPVEQAPAIEIETESGDVTDGVI